MVRVEKQMLLIPCFANVDFVGVGISLSLFVLRSHLLSLCLQSLFVQTLLLLTLLLLMLRLLTLFLHS